MFFETCIFVAFIYIKQKIRIIFCYRKRLEGETILEYAYIFPKLSHTIAENKFLLCSSSEMRISSGVMNYRTYKIIAQIMVIHFFSSRTTSQQLARPWIMKREQ